MKLGIVFPAQWADLGMLAKDDFLRCLPPEEGGFTTVQLVTKELIENIRKMPTMMNGFTEEYKVKFIQIFEKNLGKKFLMVDTWIMPGKELDYYHLLANLINEGKSLSEAAELVKKQREEDSQNEKSQ